MLYLTCVANGRIISYSQGGTFKLIEEKYLNKKICEELNLWT